MKEIEEEEKLIDTSPNEQNIKEIGKKNGIEDQKKNKLKEEIKNGTRRFSSFEVELIKAVKKEEEEEIIKKNLLETKKKKKRIILYTSKDYLFLFILLMSSSFNFCYLYLINIIISTIYIFFIEKLSIKSMKIKYLCEVFSIGYSSYLLIFKIICYILINDYKKFEDIVDNNTIKNSFIKSHENLYIDLGIYCLKDWDSKYNLIMTFLPDIFVIAVSGYSIIISFFCRAFNESDIKLIEIKNLTLRKIILLAYSFMVLYSLFNISFLSLVYIILIQFSLLLNSIQITEKNIKIFFNIIIKFSLILLFIQIILTNILNINSLRKNILNKIQLSEDNEDKYYSIFTQLGIKNAYDDNGKEITLTFFSYLFEVLFLMILYFIYIELKRGLNIKSENEITKIDEMIEMDIIQNKKIDNFQLQKNKLNIKNNVNNKNYNETEKKSKRSALYNLNIIYRILHFLMKHPNFNYEIERIFSSLWVYYYRNYYSLGMYLVLFCSFFFVDIIKNKCLILFVLTPILLITISSYHISNIDGIIEKLNEDDKVYYSKIAIEKYEHKYLEPLAGHIYYLTVILLIYNFYTRDKEKNKKSNESELKIKNNELLENIIPKNEDKKDGQENLISEEDLYENKSDESDSESDENSDNESLEEEPKNEPKVKFKESITNSITISFGLHKLLIKKLFNHIDKITLVVMYFVSVYKVNLTHVLLVLIFVLQIVIPKKIKSLYKILIIIFQFVFLIEFIIDLLKIHYHNDFNKHKNLLNIFIVYSEDLKKCDIEIFLYGVIYCFYFQHTTCNLKYIKRILEDETITYENYVNTKFEKLPNLKAVINFFYNFFLHIFFWCLGFFFIFFSCYYEINLIFGIKLLLFFVSLFIFVDIIHKKTMDSKFKLQKSRWYIILNRIFLILCSANTFCAYFYQFLCLDSFDVKKHIRDKNNNNFFIKNLPNIGFTLYEEDNLYYNFIPHFLTSFICTLYVYNSEEVLSNIDKELSKSKTKLIHEKKTIKKSEKLSDEKFKNIKEEKNEFLQDKMYADKYYENLESIKTLSRRLIGYYIIFLYTKVYWLLLFMSLGIIFSSYDLSFSILLYIIIFGLLFILKFHEIISKMRKYLSTNSYYISKVIRYSVVEKPLHYRLNKYYRSLTFKCCLFLSFLYLILLYFYGIFDLFQHGCDKNQFRGCDPSHKSIIFPDEKESDHNNLEAKIKAICLILGIYIDMKNESILKVALVHLVLSGFIIFDLYNQQIEEHYSKISTDLQKKLQKQINENNILEKYSEIADYNILIKIGLTLAGIDIFSSDNKNKNGGVDFRRNFRVSLKDKFLIKSDSVKQLLKLNESPEKKENEEIEYNLDENAPENSFLKNLKIKKFIKMIKNSSENEQKLSLGNSKGKVIIFFKKFLEEIIIFLLICISLGKFNIWTFIYLIITFYLIATKRTMWKFYILFCFIYTAILIQSFLYLSNLREETSIRDFNDIFSVLKNKFHIPWYQEYLSEKMGFFYGLGVTESQVKLICLEFLQIIVIYFYLDLFSYSINQETLNKGEKSLQGQKFNFHTLNLNQSAIDYIQKMSEPEFQEIRECLECFNFKIGKNIKEFLELLHLSKEDEIQDLKNFSKDDQMNKFDFRDIKNQTLKEVIYFRMINKELRKSMEKKTNTQYKQLPTYLLAMQEILFMYLHFVLLIFIIITSIMIAGLVSIVYISISFYYLMKSDALFLGTKYTYPIVLKKVLMIIILLDIIVQGVYSTPFFSQEEGTLGYKIFNSVGLIKVVDFGKNTTNTEEINKIDIDQNIEVYGKAFIYLLMSLQLLIYESKSFKKYYLVYLLSHKSETKKSSIINSFTFNNKRVHIFEHSLLLRQQSDDAIDDLKNIVNELNWKLSQIGKKLLTKKDFQKERPLDYVNRINKDQLDKNSKEYNSYNLFVKKGEKPNEEIESQKNEGLKTLFKKRKESKGSQYLDPSEVEQRIRDLIYKGFLIKLYSWFHKQSFSFKNLDINERIDFDIETIQGEVTIKSIIENKLNTILKILDLEQIDKAKMKEIELIIEANFDKNKKKILEENKRRKALSKSAKAKLKRAFKFARLVSKKYPDKSIKDINNMEGDEITKFKMKQKAEKEYEQKKELEDKKREEKEEYKLKQFEEVLETKLFKEYLRTFYFIEHIILFLQSIIIKHFNWICYFFMILDHMLNGSLITLVYPLSIFGFALLEYPRPKKIYWILVLYYTFIIMCVKFFIQLKIILMILDEDNYSQLINNLYHYRIGFKYYNSSFSNDFMKYIFFDAVIIICILINRNLLISEGLWFNREEEIENIYEASERITIYGTKKYSSKINAMQDLLFKYLYSPKEMLSMRKNINFDNKEVKDVKHKFPFLIKRNTEKEYNEAKRGYFERIFSKNRNEKPGGDFYVPYTIFMALICIYILFFYTNMDQDKTYGPIDLDMTQFSGAMVLFLILHIIILVYDRVIFVSQNREKISYEYIFYKKNQENGQGELLTEIENNQLKSEICKNITREKFTIIPQREIEKLKVFFNILFIQKEKLNKPLLNKYILHIFTIFLSHFMIFFYFPIKGNHNLGNASYCADDEDADNNSPCNNFNNNSFLIMFYLLYIFYLIFSGLQIQTGFYDIKRKSFFKRKGDEVLSGLSKGFNAIPFLYEIKNAIDWTFTSTCLTLFQWNKFESIYDTIFDTYCEKNDWDERPIGRRISKKKKFGIGLTLALVLILILIIPLILFSSLNPTNKLNNITGGELRVDLSLTYENGAIKNYNLFENTRADSITQMNDEDIIWKYYNYSSSVKTQNFNKEQAQRIIFSETSDRNWDLANPHILNLIKLLNLSEDHDLYQVDIIIYYDFSRPLPAESQTVSNSFVIKVYNQKEDPVTSEGAKKLSTLRNALKNCSNDSILLEEAYSPQLRITSGSDVTIIYDKKYFNKKYVQLGFQGCFLENNKTNYFNSYFTFRSFNIKTNQTEPVEFHTFSDQISDTTSGYSVLTFYISFVLLAGTYIRDFMKSEPEKIMLEEMPHPKRIVELCEGIKIARYSYDFKNEEYLYTILIELLRSPDYLKLITDSSLDHFKLREELTMQFKE